MTNNLFGTCLDCRTMTSPSQAPDTAKSDRAATAHSRLGAMAFFAAYFAYVWLRLNPEIFYEASPTFPTFQRGLPFLVESLSRPGGLSEVVAGLLSQAWYLGWAGALCLTGVAWLSAAGTGALLRAAGVAGAGWVRGIPPLLILAAFSGCGYHMVSVCALLAALAFSLLAARLARARRVIPLPHGEGTPAAGESTRPAGRQSQIRNPESVVGVARSGLLAALLLAAYGCAGGAYQVVALAAAVVETRAAGRRRGFLFWVLAQAVPFVVGTLLLDLPPRDAYWRLSPLDTSQDSTGQMAVAGLTLFFLLLALAMLPGLPTALARRMGPAAAQVRPGLRVLLGGAAALAIVLLSYHDTYHRIRRLGHHARHHQWERVIADARRIPRDQVLDIADNTFYALFRTGEMLDRVFTVPQHPEALATCLPKGTGTYESVANARLSIFFSLGDQAMALGLVNAAGHEAHEALTWYGEHPTTLRRLALVSLAREEPEAARVFLRALTRHLVERPWAEEVLRRLAQDPLLREDPDLREIRAAMLKQDPPFLLSSTDVACLGLLAQNPRNRMAYEYLLTACLLQRRLDHLARHLRRLPEFGYRQMPRHCQEAVVFYEAATGNSVEIPGYGVDRDVRLAFREFSSTVVPLQEANRMDEARAAVAPKFGNTYFYYYVFDESGVGDQ